MEVVENIYNLLSRTRYVHYMQEVLRDINIIDFAIISTDVAYKNNIYNKMLGKYDYDFEKLGYNKALEIAKEGINLSGLSEEGVLRNILGILRRWIIRCSGYMCVKKVAEETISEGIDIYMKRYLIAEEVVDLIGLNNMIGNIDFEMFTYLQESI